MRRPEPFRCVLLSSSLILLALGILLLTTEAKAGQYGPGNHITDQYRATDISAASKLKCRLAAGIAGAPARLDVALFQAEAASPTLETATPAFLPFPPANPLRAPPSR